MAIYTLEGAEAIKNVTQEVIKKHFDHKVANIKMAYIFRPEARKSKGRKIYAELKKVPNLWKSFLDTSMVLIVSETDWTKFDNVKREAMIHEALSHLEVEVKMMGEVVYSTRGYDEKVIANNIAAYGCWRKGLKELKEGFVQTKMFEDAGEDVVAKLEVVK